MKLQQLLFAAFASSVLIIGCHESSKFTAVADVHSSIDMQNQLNDQTPTELFMLDKLIEKNNTFESLKQLLTKLTAYFSLDQMKQELALMTNPTRLSHKIMFINKLFELDDLYPSSFKGLETFVKEEELIIHGELRPINI